MTIQSIPSGFTLPPVPLNVAASPTLTASLILNSVDDKVGMVFRVGKAGAIRKVMFLLQATSGSSTLSVRIETVDASGNPSGTLWDTNTLGSYSVTGSDDNTIQSVTLTADATVAQGDKIAVVFECPVTVNSVRFFSRFADDDSDFPYNCEVTDGGAWAKDSRSPIVALEYSDGSYTSHAGVYWIGGGTDGGGTAVNTTTYNNTSGTRRVALRFSLPFPTTAAGFWAWYDLDAVANMVLYDSDGTTALQTIALDPDERISTTGGVSVHAFTSSVSLLANTFYRLSLEPTSASNISAYDFAVASAAQMDSNPGGQNFHMSTHNGTSWTDLVKQRPFFGLRFNGFEAGGGGGGSIFGGAIIR